MKYTRQQSQELFALPTTPHTNFNRERLLWAATAIGPKVYFGIRPCACNNSLMPGVASILDWPRNTAGRRAQDMSNTCVSLCDPPVAVHEDCRPPAGVPSNKWIYGHFARQGRYHEGCSLVL